MCSTEHQMLMHKPIQYCSTRIVMSSALWISFSISLSLSLSLSLRSLFTCRAKHYAKLWYVLNKFIISLLYVFSVTFLLHTRYKCDLYLFWQRLITALLVWSITEHAMGKGDTWKSMVADELWTVAILKVRQWWWHWLFSSYIDQKKYSFILVWGIYFSFFSFGNLISFVHFCRIYY